MPEAEERAPTRDEWRQVEMEVKRLTLRARLLERALGVIAALPGERLDEAPMIARGALEDDGDAESE